MKKRGIWLFVFLLNSFTAFAAPALIEKSRGHVQAGFATIGTFLTSLGPTGTKIVDFFVFFSLLTAFSLIGLRAWAGEQHGRLANIMGLAFGFSLSLAIVWSGKLSVKQLFPAAGFFVILALFIFFFKLIKSLGATGIWSFILALILLISLVTVFYGWGNLVGDMKLPWDGEEVEDKKIQDKKVDKLAPIYIIGSDVVVKRDKNNAENMYKWMKSRNSNLNFPKTSVKEFFSMTKANNIPPELFVAISIKERGWILNENSGLYRNNNWFALGCRKGRKCERLNKYDNVLNFDNYIDSAKEAVYRLTNMPNYKVHLEKYNNKEINMKDLVVGIQKGVPEKKLAGWNAKLSWATGEFGVYTNLEKYYAFIGEIPETTDKIQDEPVQGIIDDSEEKKPSEEESIVIEEEITTEEKPKTVGDIIKEVCRKDFVPLECRDKLKKATGYDKDTLEEAIKFVEGSASNLERVNERDLTSIDLIIKTCGEMNENSKLEELNSCLDKLEKSDYHDANTLSKAKEIILSNIERKSKPVNEENKYDMKELAKLDDNKQTIKICGKIPNNMNRAELFECLKKMEAVESK